MDIWLNFNKRFIAVEHPAIVKNIDKVLKTLGGRMEYNEVQTVRTVINLGEEKEHTIYGYPLFSLVGTHLDLLPHKY